MTTARTRIYRQRTGRWIAETSTPDGHRTRQGFATGRAALIALDRRNHPYWMQLENLRRAFTDACRRSFSSDGGAS